MIRETSSPFSPGQPVSPELFVGRRAEVESALARVHAARQGRLQVVFLSGERGIGKSSLAAFVRVVAEQDYEAVGAHVLLGGVTSVDDVVERILDRILKAAQTQPWFDQVKSLFGDRIQSIGLFGVSVAFRPTTAELRNLTTNFAGAIDSVARRLPNGAPLLLVLDDINGIAASADFANWLKSLIDELATSFAGTRLCLLLVGLEARRQSLIERQPSLARVFDLIHLSAWGGDEAAEFFRQAFDTVGITVEDAALAHLVQWAEGFPVLAHEIGDATFHHTSGGVVTLRDAQEGVREAAEVVGRKHLEPRLFAAIRSEKYRSIFHKLVSSLDLGISFTRAEALQVLNTGEAAVLDNFLRRMLAMDVLAREDERGRYRFLVPLHFLNFIIRASR